MLNDQNCGVIAMSLTVEYSEDGLIKFHEVPIKEI